jgi:hypothetical protein
MDWMISEIVNRHRDGNLKDGVPNPTLEMICQLVAKAATAITPNVQRRAFRNTGLTLAVDGSEDNQLSPSLKSLFSKHNEDAILRHDSFTDYLSRSIISAKRPTIAKIFQVLFDDFELMKPEDFSVEPTASSRKKKTTQK